MKRALTLLAVLAFSPTYALAQTELKGSPESLRDFLHPQENRVTLSAQAEERAYSDEAIVSVVVTTEAKTLQASITANSDLRESMTKRLIQAGIDAGSINNSKFSSSPQYGWFGKEPDSYEVVNRVAININDEEKLKTIAGIVDQHPEISLAGTEFKHSLKDQFMAQVKQQALDKVMVQKKLYEASLGVTLVPVNFRDHNIHSRPTRGASQLEEIVVTAQLVSKSRDSYRERAPAPASFDEINYSAELSVEFKVVSKAP